MNITRKHLVTCALVSLLALAFTLPVTAQTQVVVPNAYSGTAGTSTFLGPMATAARTYQLLINANQLSSLIGLQLNGIQWRLPTSATADWPAADISFTNFDIRLSESVAPANRSLTFANNVVGTQTLVRSGALNIPANSFTFGSTPNAFGFNIGFDPYLYTGGHLLFELRHSGFTGTSRSLDALSTSTSGYGTDYSGAWTSSYTGTAGSAGNFSVSQFSAVAVPEPGSILLMAGSGFVGLLSLRLVRRRLKNRWKRTR